MKAIAEEAIQIGDKVHPKNVEFECSESVFNSLKEARVKIKKVEEKKKKDEVQRD